MAIPFEQIQSDFNRLRTVLTKDLQEIVNQIVAGGRGEYAATLVIASACEILGKLRNTGSDQAERFFAEELASKLPKSIANEVYAALRNGLVHSYETKRIEVDRRKVHIRISSGGKRHLRFDKGTSSIFVDVVQLHSDLDAAFARLEKHLRADAGARDHFFAEWKKERVQVIGGQDREVRLKFLDES